MTTIWRQGKPIVREYQDMVAYATRIRLSLSKSNHTFFVELSNYVIVASYWRIMLFSYVDTLKLYFKQVICWPSVRISAPGRITNSAKQANNEMADSGHFHIHPTKLSHHICTQTMVPSSPQFWYCTHTSNNTSLLDLNWTAPGNFLTQHVVHLIRCTYRAMLISLRKSM